MRNDQKSKPAVDGIMPAACAVATIAGAVVWSSAALLVGFAVVALAGSVAPFATRLASGLRRPRSAWPSAAS